MDQHCHPHHSENNAASSSHQEECGCHDHCCCDHQDEHNPLHGEHHQEECGCHDHCCCNHHDEHNPHHEESDSCGCACGCHAQNGDDHSHGAARQWVLFAIAATVALVTWILQSLTEHHSLVFPHSEWTRYGYLVAYLFAAQTVFKGAFRGLCKGQIFNEFFLMIVATFGAIILGDYPEAVGVMLFYLLGENLQGLAVGRARKSIASLVALRPDTCTVVEETSGDAQLLNPQSVALGSLLRVERGARVPLDGVLCEPPSSTTEGKPYTAAQFDTSALTGESVARQVPIGQRIMSGYIVLDRPIYLRTDRTLGEDALSRILQMVEDAAARKAPAEQMLTKIARVYTPVVVALAALLVILPLLVQWLLPLTNIVLSDWVYRALVFLVASCPCALVLSIPLSYFAGIGRASQRGILFKGGLHLDAVTHVDTVVFDKTGTLTTGVVTVQDGMDSGAEGAFSVSNDEARPTSKTAVETLRQMGIHTVMLSGDYPDAVNALGIELGLDEWHSRLLPQDKLQHVERLMNEGRHVAFVGDGINDAPVLARAHVGFAMGAGGTDAAVETADVVLSTDDPLRVADAIRVGRSTRRLVWENVGMAIGIKTIVLLLSALGLAGMWAAVFADTGVVLLCVLNVLRPRR